MQIIPLNTRPCFRLTAVLETYPVELRFRYNYIASQWFYDLDCEDLGLASHGFALGAFDDLLAGQAVPELGRLMLVDTQGYEDPTFDGLGVRWKLIYQTRAEVDAA